MCGMLTGHQVIIDVMLYVQFIDLLEAVLNARERNGNPLIRSRRNQIALSQRSPGKLNVDWQCFSGFPGIHGVRMFKILRHFCQR